MEVHGLIRSRGGRHTKMNKSNEWMPLVVQWLRLPASMAGGAGLISGRGTKILHAVTCDQLERRPHSNEDPAQPKISKVIKRMN